MALTAIIISRNSETVNHEKRIQESVPLWCGRSPAFLSAVRTPAPVFSPGGESAADVPLGLVLIQQRPYAPVERRMDLRQALRQILVYGAFADAESGGGGADSAFVFQ